MAQPTAPLANAQNAGNVNAVLTVLLPVLSAIAAALDFLKPLTDGLLGFSPLSAYFWAGVIGGPVCYMLSRKEPASEWHDKLRVGAVVCGLMAITGAIPVVGGWFSPSIAEKGAIATASSSASEVQTRILAKISADTGTLVEKATRIEDTVKHLKRETSEDPRKELANLGVQWDTDSFATALTTGDKRTLELFMAGGFRPGGFTIRQFMFQRFTPDMGNILSAYPDQLPQELCTERFGTLGWNQDQFILEMSTDPGKKAFYFSMCDPKKLKDLYKSLIVVGKNSAEEKACETRVKRLPWKPIDLYQSDEETLASMHDVWNAAFDDAAKNSAPGRTKEQLAQDAVKKWKAAEASMEKFLTATRLISSEVDKWGAITAAAEEGCQAAYDSREPTSAEDAEHINNVLAVIP